MLCLFETEKGEGRKGKEGMDGRCDWVKRWMGWEGEDSLGNPKIEGEMKWSHLYKQHRTEVYLEVERKRSKPSENSSYITILNHTVG